MTLPATPASGAVSEEDVSTRQRILRLIVEEGPISAVQLADGLDLTPAGVRRHVGVMLAAGEIAEHDAPGPRRVQRGRPPRRYVATARGQAALSSAYADLAVAALAFLEQAGGTDAVRGFAEARAAELRSRHGAAVARAGDDVAARVDALAAGLASDGYAASVRPLPTGVAVQLCQGHCPVQAVAARYPQLCEAEAQLFSDLLGVHVQRLSTLASGGHVCTTHVPLPTTLAIRTPGSSTETPDPDRPAATTEGTR